MLIAVGIANLVLLVWISNQIGYYIRSVEEERRAREEAKASEEQQNAFRPPWTSGKPVESLEELKNAFRPPLTWGTPDAFRTTDGYLPPPEPKE